MQSLLVGAAVILFENTHSFQANEALGLFKAFSEKALLLRVEGLTLVEHFPLSNSCTHDDWLKRKKIKNEDKVRNDDSNVRLEYMQDFDIVKTEYNNQNYDKNVLTAFCDKHSVLPLRWAWACVCVWRHSAVVQW